jgi:ubiquinone biosynthesis protein COQ9
VSSLTLGIVKAINCRRLLTTLCRELHYAESRTLDKSVFAKRLYMSNVLHSVKVFFAKCHFFAESDNLSSVYDFVLGKALVTM